MRAGVTRLAADALPAPQSGSRDRSNIAWMAVGGAALLVGLAIGGDSGNIVAIGGGVIGLIGLFRYMR